MIDPSSTSQNILNCARETDFEANFCHVLHHRHYQFSGKHIRIKQTGGLKIWIIAATSVLEKEYSLHCIP